LEYAFAHCPAYQKKNKQLILHYLVPIKMYFGSTPTDKLLYKYKLDHFVELSRALKIGNLKMFDAAIEKYRILFIKTGIYLLLEKLRMLVYRNLFRKMYVNPSLLKVL